VQERGVMRYLSVCSGIEAATVAWHPLGWTPVAFSEIEAFPCAVLAHHYPSVPNWGDMTKFKEWPDADVDVLVGGTPCQSFSVAGLRKGLDDPRGNLMLTYLAIARRYRPEWLVWENVPGVLSSSGGRDFATFLRGLEECGYGFAYRVLDAQYFGVAQRRRRVFVVGHLGDWRRAAAVLLERASLSGHPAPSREARKDLAPTISPRTRGGGGLGTDFDCDGGLIPQTVGALCADAHPGAYSGQDAYTGRLIAHSLRADGFDASEDGTGRGTPLVPVAVGFNWQNAGGYGNANEGLGITMEGVGPLQRCQTPAVVYAIQERAVCENASAGPDGIGIRADDTAYTLEARTVPQAVGFAQNQRDEVRTMDVAGALASEPGMKQQTFVALAPSLTASNDPSRSPQSSEVTQQVAAVLQASMQVRRLTPRECERLQGFPDDYTLIPYRNKPAADGPRYKALGNSMAVPVMAWIGQRIQMVAALGRGEG
jgi:DNA (cytosine-5)-methyltransferase 1